MRLSTSRCSHFGLKPRKRERERKVVIVTSVLADTASPVVPSDFATFCFDLLFFLLLSEA